MFGCICPGLTLFLSLLFFAMAVDDQFNGSSQAALEYGYGWGFITATGAFGLANIAAAMAAYAYNKIVIEKQTKKCVTTYES